MKSLNVGIIGLGVGEAHISGWETRPNIHVTHICDINADKLEKVSQRYPGKATTLDPDKILNDQNISAVSIASYDDAHHAQIITALKNGKHVFAEKPLCLHDWELEEIKVALARHPNCHLSSNLILRKSPRFQELRQDYQDGKYGDIYMLDGDYNYGRVHKLIDGWRGKIPAYSVVHGGAIHLIDLMQWITGQKIQEVVAIGTDLAVRDHGVNINDTVVAILKFNGGVIGKVSSNYSCVHPHFHKFMVYGTNATFENGLDGASLFEQRDPDIPPTAINTEYPGIKKGDLIPSFVDSILGMGAPEVSAEDTLSSMAVCLAIERSVKSRCFETVATL
jgi:predicted dehydrogenase